MKFCYVLSHTHFFYKSLKKQLKKEYSTSGSATSVFPKSGPPVPFSAYFSVFQNPNTPDSTHQLINCPCLSWVEVGKAVKCKRQRGALLQRLQTTVLHYIGIISLQMVWFFFCWLVSWRASSFHSTSFTSLLRAILRWWGM